VYAVVRTGGKEYKVSVGDFLTVEKLDAEAGSTVELGEVLMASDGKDVYVGRPLVENVVVKAEVIEQKKAPKVIVFKMKRRKKYRRKRGHRQWLSVLKITDIELPKAAKLKPKKVETEEDKPAPAKAEPKVKKPAKKKAEKVETKEEKPKKTRAKKKAAPKKEKTAKAEAPKEKKASKGKAAKKTTKNETKKRE
jgi:large subunit ribosomal protein L21